MSGDWNDPFLEPEPTAGLWIVLVLALIAFLAVILL